MASATERLEAGEVIVQSGRAFAIGPEELAQVTGPLALGAAKSISFDRESGRVRGVGEAGKRALLGGLLARYAAFAEDLLLEIAPTYRASLQLRRTSLRTRAADAPALSERKDDRRLHADAFPSTPTGGDRILRVFTNINPSGAPRLWRLGEPFEAYARRWLDNVRRPWPGEARLLQAVGITRGRRSDYDALMLGLHDRAKLDDRYQREAAAREVAFAAGNSWIVYTDAAVHAAIAGQFALEQTFSLPVDAMADPERSPLRILERLTGRALAHC